MIHLPTESAGDTPRDPHRYGRGVRIGDRCPVSAPRVRFVTYFTRLPARVGISGCNDPTARLRPVIAHLLLYRLTNNRGHGLSTLPRQVPQPFPQLSR